MSTTKLPPELKAMRVAARAVGSVQKSTGVVKRSVGKVGFPYRAPKTPGSVTPLPKEKKTGSAYDTGWARKPVARYARAALIEGPVRLGVRALASPARVGQDRVADLQRAARTIIDDGGSTPPAIFVANHHSHLDAPLLITSIPEPWRHHLVVAAAADYFFATRVTGAASALVLGAIPLERHRINRTSSDLAQSLIEDGWSLLIFPEGGRSPDGWGQPFQGGAAFLSIRTGAPIVPIHVEGTGALFGKGDKRPKRGTTRVTFGSPLTADPDENARRFGVRIERAVAALGDEAISDWWTARQRAAAGTSTSLTGPDATSWRRAWALADRRARGKQGQRRRQKRRWPKLDD